MRRAAAVAAALAVALALAGCQGSSARTPTAKRESAIVLRLGVGAIPHHLSLIHI